MCSMTVVVNGVVVVVVDIIAMIREIRATVPKVVSKVEVIVVDTRVDDGHHHALACVTLVPHLVSIHLGDI